MSHYFSFADLSHRLADQQANINGHIATWSPPPPGLNLGMMVACSCMYLLLSWYFGQVCALPPAATLLVIVDFVYAN